MSDTKVTCPHCTRPVGVDKDGFLVHHLMPVRRITCNGYGMGAEMARRAETARAERNE